MIQQYSHNNHMQNPTLTLCCAGTFREDNFQKAIGALTEAAAEAKGRPGAKSGKGSKRGSSDTGPNDKPDIYKIVRMCMERNYDPLIVFSFSKKECENLAKQVGLGAWREFRSHVYLNQPSYFGRSFWFVPHFSF